MRVIVAGSKDWPYTSVVIGALELCTEASWSQPAPLTVVHPHPGHKHGPEKVADDWALDQSYRGSATVSPPERHPPHWDAKCRPSCSKDHRRRVDVGRTTCPSAGYYRVDDMVSRPCDLALIFHHHDRPAWLGYLQRRLVDLKVPIQEFRP